MQKAILIVDGAYFSKAAGELQSRKSNVRLDVDKISEFISKELAKDNIHLNHKFWFDSAIDPTKDSQKPWWDALRNKQFQVQMLGVKTMDVFCQEPGCNCKHSKKSQSKNPIKRTVQAGVDVAIATKVLTSVAEGHCDVIVLLAGDGDFKEALRWVKEVKNKEIWVFGWKHSTSNFLREMASQQKVFDLSVGDFTRGQEGPDDGARLSDFFPPEKKNGGHKEADFPALEARVIPGMTQKVKEPRGKKNKAADPELQKLAQTKPLAKDPLKILAPAPLEEPIPSQPIYTPIQVQQVPTPSALVQPSYQPPATVLAQPIYQPIQIQQVPPSPLAQPAYSAPAPQQRPAHPTNGTNNHSPKKKPGSSYKFGGSSYQNHPSSGNPPSNNFPPQNAPSGYQQSYPTQSLKPVQTGYQNSPQQAKAHSSQSTPQNFGGPQNYQTGQDILKNPDFFQGLFGDLV